MLEISCGQRQSKLLNRLMQVTAVKKPAWSQVKLFKLPVLHETSSIIQITFLSLSHKVLKFSKKSFSHFLVAKITELDKSHSRNCNIMEVNWNQLSKRNTSRWYHCQIHQHWFRTFNSIYNFLPWNRVRTYSFSPRRFTR